MHPATQRNERPVYFLTFTTYGTWLPGDERGSAERFRTPSVTNPLEPNPRRKANAEQRLIDPPLTMSKMMCDLVADTAMSVCEFRGWALHAINVRTNHVHVVVSAEDEPEVVMTTIKAWSTRRMREAGMLRHRTKVWTRHGSTRYLTTEKDVQEVIAYVLEGQGADLGGVRSEAQE